MAEKKLGDKSRVIFAENLERYIKISGKAKQDIAMAIGVKPTTISDWLACRGYPRQKYLEPLAEALGVTVPELVGDVAVGQTVIPREDQEVLDAFHKVPKEKREFILSMIRAAIDNL